MTAAHLDGPFAPGASFGLGERISWTSYIWLLPYLMFWQPNGRWRGVATVHGSRRTRFFDSEVEALVWADTEMRRVAAAVQQALQRDSRHAIGLANHAADATASARPALTLAAYVPAYLAHRTLERERSPRIDATCSTR